MGYGPQIVLEISILRFPLSQALFFACGRRGVEGLGWGESEAVRSTACITVCLVGMETSELSTIVCHLLLLKLTKGKHN